MERKEPTLLGHQLQLRDTHPPQTRPVLYLPPGRGALSTGQGTARREKRDKRAGCGVGDCLRKESIFITKRDQARGTHTLTLTVTPT